MVRHVDISSLLIRSKHCENESEDCMYLGRLYVSYHEVLHVPYHKVYASMLWFTQQKTHNLFRVDENSLEQCCAAHIVRCCQRYCSALLHLIAG